MEEAVKKMTFGFKVLVLWLVCIFGFCVYLTFFSFYIEGREIVLIWYDQPAQLGSLVCAILLGVLSILGARATLKTLTEE